MRKKILGVVTIIILVLHNIYIGTISADDQNGNNVTTGDNLTTNSGSMFTGIDSQNTLTGLDLNNTSTGDNTTGNSDMGTGNNTTFDTGNINTGFNYTGSNNTGINIVLTGVENNSGIILTGTIDLSGTLVNHTGINNTGFNTTGDNQLTGENLSGNIISTNTGSVFTGTQTGETLSCSLHLLPSKIVSGGSTLIEWFSTGGNTFSIDNGIGNVEMSGSRIVTPNISSGSLTYNLVVGNGLIMISCSGTIDVMPNYINLDSSEIVQGSGLIITGSKDIQTIFQEFKFTGDISSLRKLSISGDYHNIITNRIINSGNIIDIYLNSGANIYAPLGLNQFKKEILSGETQLVEGTKKTTIMPKVSIGGELPIILDNYATLIFSGGIENAIKYGYRETNNHNWTEVNLSSQVCEPTFPYDCGYISGNSVIIKTYHFTQFAIISQQDISTTPTDQTSSPRKIESGGGGNIYTYAPPPSTVNNAIVSTGTTTANTTGNIQSDKINQFMQNIENRSLNAQQKIIVYNKILEYTKILKVTRPTKKEILLNLENKVVSRLNTLKTNPNTVYNQNTIITSQNSISVNTASENTIDITFRPVIHSSKKKVYIIYKKNGKYIFKRGDGSFSDQMFNSPEEIVDYIEKNNK